MIVRIHRALRGDEGASVVEYGPLAAIDVGIVVQLDGRVTSAFSTTNSCVSASDPAC